MKNKMILIFSIVSFCVVSLSAQATHCKKKSLDEIYNFLEKNTIYDYDSLTESDYINKQKNVDMVYDNSCRQRQKQENNLAKDYRNVQCDKCRKYGHIKKDCLLCTNCLRIGHESSTCTSCYICGGSNHRTLQCRPPQRPRRPIVEVGDPSASYSYIKHYSQYIENWKRKRDRYYERKQLYYQALSNMGKNVEMPQNDLTARDDSFDLHEVMRDVTKNFRHAGREEKKAIADRNHAFNDNFYDGYVRSCPKCGECIGGGCDSHP